MSDTEDVEQDITRLLPFFYPSSPFTTPNPTSAATRLAKHLEAEPIGTATLAIDLSTLLLHVATARPAHIDHILQTVQILINIPSLPPIDNPAFDHITTFEEMFQVSFQEDVDDTIGRTIEVEDSASHLAVSLLAARARSIGILNTPEILGCLAEGLGFSDEVVHSYQGDEAKIASIGSCIQLLCGASPLLRDQPERFAKDRILAALDGLQISSIDPLIKVRFISSLEFWNLHLTFQFTSFPIQLTKSHLEKKPLVDLTSEEIIHCIKGFSGWLSKVKGNREVDVRG
jgi:hypothetical protein